MKITKRQLRRIIKESLSEGMPGVDRQVRDLWHSDDRDFSAPPGEEDYYAPAGEGEQATDAQLKGGWGSWLSERGLEFEDLDDLAQFAGAPNRTWLDINPPNDGMIGPADVEVWAKDQKAAREILATRIGGYKGTTLPGGKKIGEGTSLDNMPDSWRQILGNCLGDS